MTISNEAISAARKAVENAMRQRTYDRHAHDEEVFHEGVDDITTAALSAAAPILRAEALHEAADAIDAQRDASDHERTPDDCESVRDHNAGRFLGKTVASRLLRARADQIDGGNK